MGVHCTGANRFSEVSTIKQIKTGRRKNLSTKLFVAEQLLSENLFNLLSVWVFESQRAGRKRRRFSLVVDPCRFIIERTADLLFNVFGKYSKGKHCSRNASSKGAVLSFFHPLQYEMGRKTFIW